ncbi:tRNA threonylcarbamoyladenosine dehydratase [Acetanaerobacterium elongatum]|uniref:tRNA A37 threonylcarbamoyladenosine dehydratase n=1 Tax=Acetanaerobacterium elongatum TaxID=258515 RepID=A0A1G9WZG0_9FIRM|nr:tRNA threonylcarbamoyladenosine dehydratase [Acetanaerobacterium elongatum]SDM89944.1 tRNA A37 threonylcarbamoyladenosine dehydratase [Acetanaerobacterium elongatum]
MQDEFSRTKLLLGAPAVDALKASRVAIFGIGGVGSYVVEALARSGVGGFALFDDDKVCLTNINRQLIATHATVGRQKTEVMRERILDINPKAQVEVFSCFYTAENADNYDLTQYNYIVDAIDTVSSKLELILRAYKLGVPIISCMGAGNKLDPTRFEVTDIYKTSVCPLARVMRKELKNLGVDKLKVVYSKEPPIAPVDIEGGGCKTGCVCPPDTKQKCTIRRQIPGSVAFVPSAAGLILAGEVIKDLVAPYLAKQDD